MTPSKLSAIRVECAILMGWHQEQEGYWNNPKQHKHGRVMPDDYPIDNNAALTLATALADEGWDMKYIKKASQPDHLVKFEKGHGAGYDYYSATAPTFALALSQAFLKVHRSKKD